ncbi:hypothetical protein N9937_00260 [bacterium]|nr:hypothetical protein [bacterium]
MTPEENRLAANVIQCVNEKLKAHLRANCECNSSHYRHVLKEFANPMIALLAAEEIATLRGERSFKDEY